MSPLPERPTLLCCAFPFGYGPAVKLLLIARRLRAAGVDAVFLGHGIAHEMAAQSSDAFDEVIHAHPGDPSVARHIASAAGLFSMMDRDFAALALAQGKPVYVADSLRWMRDQLPAPFTAAQRYWVQNFLPLANPNSASVDRNAAPVDRELRARWETERAKAPHLPPADAPAHDPHPSPNTVPVGPIVEARAPVPPDQRRGLVINLGGCETPAGPQAENFAYAEFVLCGILASGVTGVFGGKVTLLAGHHAIAHLRATFPDCGIALHTATHDDALALFQTAACILTSPGLTATLECFQFAVPTYFLPPQNYSQWCILQHLQSSSLASGSFTWSQIKPHFPALDSVPESARTDLVRQAITEVSAHPHARTMFAASLQQRLLTDPGPLAIRQREFFESLGPNGVDTIAAELIGIFGRDRTEKAASRTV